MIILENRLDFFSFFIYQKIEQFLARNFLNSIQDVHSTDSLSKG